MIYGVDRAAAKIGLSKRQFLRDALASGKNTKRIGSRGKVLFTESDIEDIIQFRKRTKMPTRRWPS